MLTDISIAVLKLQKYSERVNYGYHGVRLLASMNIPPLRMARSVVEITHAVDSDCADLQDRIAIILATARDAASW